MSSGFITEILIYIMYVIFPDTAVPSEQIRADEMLAPFIKSYQTRVRTPGNALRPMGYGECGRLGG